MSDKPMWSLDGETIKFLVGNIVMDESGRQSLNPLIKLHVTKNGICPLMLWNMNPNLRGIPTRHIYSK